MKYFTKSILYYQQGNKSFIILSVYHFTLKSLSIGTPKTINFPFVSNGKLMVFRCPNIQAHYNEAIIYLNFGTLKNNEFSIWNSGFQVSQHSSTL